MRQVMQFNYLKLSEGGGRPNGMFIYSIPQVKKKGNRPTSLWFSKHVLFYSHCQVCYMRIMFVAF